jgi:PucR C-terminal helix-turn-helix domain/GGDEF-like domain
MLRLTKDVQKKTFIVKVHEARDTLVGRLRGRSSEIEAAIFTYLRDFTGPVADDNSEYMLGMRNAIGASIEFGLKVIQHGEEWEGPIPSAVLAQARRSAREGVELDAVLRRYAVGDKLFEEFVVEEADGVPYHALRLVLGGQVTQIDRLLQTIAGEYRRELEKTHRSPARRLTRLVRRLLDDDRLIDLNQLDYDFEAVHLGAIIKGPMAEKHTRTITAAFGHRALVVSCEEQTAWAWLGGRRELAAQDFEHHFLAHAPAELSLAVGEPGRGIAGWRLTHHEAQAATQVMLRRPERVVRSRDVLLLAAMLRDEKLATSLLRKYVAPLDSSGGGGPLRETVRAYLATGNNAASTASALRMDRSTVYRHLRKVEEQLGRLLPSCQAELRIALELEELEGQPRPTASAP